MRRFAFWSIWMSLVTVLLVLAPSAAADHTNPRTPLAPVNGATETGLVRGEGTWRHLARFPGGASNALTGGGTDLEFFTPAGSKDLYGAFGTLGQATWGASGSASSSSRERAPSRLVGSPTMARPTARLRTPAGPPACSTTPRSGHSAGSAC
jgi:hypothetical protein